MPKEELASLRTRHQVDRRHAHGTHVPRLLAPEVGLQLHAQLKCLLVVVADDVGMPLAATRREVEQFRNLRVVDREVPHGAWERRLPVAAW